MLPRRPKTKTSTVDPAFPACTHARRSGEELADEVSILPLWFLDASVGFLSKREK